MGRYLQRIKSIGKWVEGEYHQYRLILVIILTSDPSCKDQRKAVAICLQRSPCVLIERHTPKECIENPELAENLPELCKAQMKSFWECKRGWFDMSKRFRGNAPLSTGKYDETYDKLSSGNFDPMEEFKKLKQLDSSNKE